MALSFMELNLKFTPRPKKNYGVVKFDSLCPKMVHVPHRFRRQ